MRTAFQKDNGHRVDCRSEARRVRWFPDTSAIHPYPPLQPGARAAARIVQWREDTKEKEGMRNTCVVNRYYSDGILFT